MQQLLDFLTEQAADLALIDSPTCPLPETGLLGFTGTIQLIENPTPGIPYQAQLTLTFTGDEEAQERVNDHKFKLFQILEDTCFNALAETSNKDACSFTYDLDTNHMGDTWVLTTSITDYLS